MIQRWGFQCKCSLCSASEESRELSDKRRERIKALRELALKAANEADYLKAVTHYHKLMKLAEKERLYPQFGEHYWVMTQLYSALQDRNDTLKYAQMAHTELSKYQESDRALEDTIKHIESLLAVLTEPN